MIKKKLTLVFVLIIIAFLILLSPFYFFNLALMNNKSPSISLNIFHNYLHPLVLRLDENNLYKKSWIKYSYWACDMHKEACDNTLIERSK